MITKIKTYWDMTQIVKEHVNSEKVELLIDSIFPDSDKWGYNIYKTPIDEVLQIFNDDTCYTVIGGSSADRSEWRENFNWRPLVSGYIHNGFHRLACSVVGNPLFVERETMVWIGHSRGGAGASVCCELYGGFGVGFGSPKAFRKRVDIDFLNILNPLDPVTHVVPFFKNNGKIRKYKFWRNPHTKYGKHIKDSDHIFLRGEL